MADNRIAYGLAKENGIDTTGMSPKQVWDALKKKGITPESVDKTISEKEAAGREEPDKKYNDDKVAQVEALKRKLTTAENRRLSDYKVPKEPIQRKPEHAEKWAKYDKDYEYYKSKEPQITADIDEISKQTGMSLIGREYRLKGKGSYDRKVNDKRIGGEYKPLGDVVRYTFEHSMDNAPGQIKANLMALKNKGYKIVAIDNKWKQPGAYNGINVDVISPSGVPMEIQYMTALNHEIKEGMHVYYEIARDSRTPKDIRELAEIKMDELSKKWKRPKGIEEV